MGKKTLAAVLTAAMLLGSLAGCKKPVEEVVLESTPAEPELEIVQEVEEKVEAWYNPLTGEEVSEEEAIRRPYSFMVNNCEAAWPQVGIDQADLVYEWPYEGSATRLMAVYSDPTVTETIGALRSARHDFVEMSMPLHTIFVHWGGSKPGYQALKDNKINKVDGMSGDACFFRDQDRLNEGRALEHTAMVDTKKLVERAIEKGYKQETEIEPAFCFNHEDEAVSFEDQLAYDVTIQISGETKCNLKYQEDIEKYHKFEYGQQQRDGKTDTPVELDNVFILYGRITSYDGEHVWRDLKLEEGGTGYYMTKGTKTPITWKKETKKDRFVYLNEIGEEVLVNPGKTWVIIAEKGAETSFAGKETGTETTAKQVD